MIKKAVFFACMIFVLIACVISIGLMYQNDISYNVSIKPEDIKIIDDETELYVVEVGDIEKHVVLDGVVAPYHENEVIDVRVYGKPSNIESYISIGEVLDENVVFAKSSGKRYKTEGKVRCIDIQVDECCTTFSFLDYSKLYIKAQIPDRYASDTLMGQGVVVECNQEKMAGTLLHLGGYCENGTVMARVSYENEVFLLRPGTMCKVKVLLEEKHNVISVPSQFLIYSEVNDEYRVLIVRDEMVMNQKVSAGVIGDENVEIVSGLERGETIMLPESEMSLKYYLVHSEDK